MADLVCIRIFGNRIEGDLAKGLLAANGIEAVLTIDDIGGMYPGALTGGGARLMVASEDVGAAAALLGDEE